MTKPQQLVKEAQRLALEAETWADLSNALFNPTDGLLTKAYPKLSQRREFQSTKEYETIRNLLAESMERSGVVEGATPKKSGRFVVRLPLSLHAALEREARHEKVSLNQLVVAKLAAQLRDLPQSR